jgi:hypothetical protein
MRRWVWRSVRIHYHTLDFATDFCGYLQSISSNSRLTLTDVNPAQEKGVRERKANKTTMFVSSLSSLPHMKVSRLLLLQTSSPKD